MIMKQLNNDNHVPNVMQNFLNPKKIREENFSQIMLKFVSIFHQHSLNSHLNMQAYRWRSSIYNRKYFFFFFEKYFHKILVEFWVNI